MADDATAKITLIVEGEQAAKDAFKNVSEALQQTGDTSVHTSTQFGSMHKALEELTPKTDSATNAFTSMKGVLGEAFENPTQAVTRLGGALATDLTSGLGAAGVAAGLAVAAIGAVGFAAFELAEKAAAVGGHLKDMGEKTGLSVPVLSKLSLAAQIAGTDLDALTRAVFMLEKGMGEGSANVEKGLQRIGLSSEALKRAGPDQYLTLIADHLKTIEDPAARAATVMEIFGRQGREIIPTLMKLDEALELTGDIQPWTAEQAAAAEHFEMQMTSLKVHLEALSVALGRDLIGPVSAFVSGIVSAGQAVNRWVDLSGGIVPMLQTIGAAWRTAAAAIDVFRGSVEKLPPITGDAKKGVEDWHAAVAALALKVPTLTDALDVDKRASKDLADQHRELAAEQKKAAEEAKKWAAVLDEVNSAGQGWQGTLDTIDGSIIDNMRDLTAAGVPLKTLETYYGLTTTQGKAFTDMLKDEAATTKLWGDIHAQTYKLAQEHEKQWKDEALKNAALVNKNVIANLNDQTKFRQEHETTVMKAALNTFDFQRVEILRWLMDEKAKLEARGGNWTAAWEQAQQVAQDKMDAITNAQQDAFATMQAQEQNWSNGFTKIIGGVPALMQQAFTGGGGMSGFGNAITSGLGALGGQQLITGPLTKMFNSAAPALLTHFGSTITTAIGGAIPLIGPAIGALAPVLMGALKKLFGGPSAMELEGRKVEAAFEAQFGSFSKMMTAVGAAYDATGRNAAMAQADVAALMAAEKLGGQAATDAANKIKAAFTEQQQDATDLTAAVQRYKFSLAELGPTMQRQQLDQQAQQLLNDWRLLVGSGMDIVTVDQHMAASIQDYLTKARQTGQEVPVAMKPILQSMIDQGTLTDENGVAITDLKDLGVTFSETMTQGFEKVVAKLDQLLTKIGLVPAAVNAIPTERTIHVGFQYDEYHPPSRDDESYAARGGLVTAHGVQYLDLGGFIPRGTDTVPAMLTPGEGVVNRTGMDRLGAAGLRDLNRGGGGVSAAGLRDAVAPLHAEIKHLRETLTSMLQVQPKQIRDAIQLARA